LPAQCSPFDLSGAYDEPSQPILHGGREATSLGSGILMHVLDAR
jgi:hypothetical protein